MRQLNKWKGLQKLKKIAGTTNPHWKVTPHITLTNPKQFRKSKLKGAQRLLVRTDERGKEYKALAWTSMPRDDVITNRTQHELQQRIKKVVTRHGAIPDMSKKVILLHPTRARSAIAFSGNAEIEMERGKPVLYVRFVKTPDPNSTTHRHMYGNRRTYTYKQGTFVPTPKDFFESIAVATERVNPFVMRQATINRRLLAFIDKAIRERHIKVHRPGTEISFVTYKDAPTTLEFFDLIEKRDHKEEKERRERFAREDRLRQNAT